MACEKLLIQPFPCVPAVSRSSPIHNYSASSCFVYIPFSCSGSSSFRSQPSYSSFASAPASAPVSADESVLQSKTLSELRALAKQRGVRGDTKAEIIKLLLAAGVSAPQPSSFSASNFGSFTPAVAATVAQESVEEYERRLQVINFIATHAMNGHSDFEQINHFTVDREV